MFKSIKTNPIIILFSIFIIFLQILVSAEDTLQDTITEQNEKDTTQQSFPEKRRAREPWEYVVSAPIWIATSPLWLLYKGTAAVIGFVDEHDIPEKVERVLVSEDGTREIMPDYSSRTGGGIYFWKKGLVSQSSELKISGSYWLTHRHSIAFDFCRIEPVNKILFTDSRFLYEYVPDEPFFGLGPKSSLSDEKNYTHRELGGSLGLGKGLTQIIDVRLEGSLRQYKISEGMSEDLSTIDSLNYCKMVLGGLKAEINIDTRNRKGHPTRGTQFNISGGFQDEIRRFGGYDRSRNTVYGYTYLSADIKQYLHLPWSKGRVLALRAGLETKDEMEDKQIPFFCLAELGSDETIRGFSRGRFRDKDAVLASAEYRYPIWGDHPNSLDAFVFIDVGQVSDFIFDHFRRDNMRYGYGFGFRFYNDEKDDLMAKISFGFSKDEYRVIFTLNE